MKIKNIASLIGLLVVVSLVLGACAPQQATEAPVTEEPSGVDVQAPVVTEAPATEAPAEPATTRTGAWVDEIVFT
ncbi:MAG TPA: hypothetical protein VLT51_03405, partial [Anaerolineales bacterium]|nr:hypothetical protein [Anaerolineales bacterium]